MKMLIVFLLVTILSISILSGCGNSGQQSSGNATPPAREPAQGAVDDPANSAGEAKLADEGARASLEISNEDTEKGTLSAICPAGWHDHSDGEYLFFSESQTPGDYSKPYIRLGYAPTATLTGGSGEDISFELGGKKWEGLFNSDYNTYNVAHQLDGGGGLSAVSMGAGPDDALYQQVLESILVEF
ncbi:hypothetical protein LJC42_08070 [Eubacteriales bacterium OttesenSCG-928-K08]|nr:hypothetical protein [Eubacteriales bacterium OttesenSCG-928-K08]